MRKRHSPLSHPTFPRSHACVAVDPPTPGTPSAPPSGCPHSPPPLPPLLPSHRRCPSLSRPHAETSLRISARHIPSVLARSLACLRSLPSGYQICKPQRSFAIPLDLGRPARYLLSSFPCSLIPRFGSFRGEAFRRALWLRGAMWH